MNTYKTSVYIDGFNFYHVAIVHKIGYRPHYPSLKNLCEKKLKLIFDQEYGASDRIKPPVQINYFTAEVRSIKRDPDPGKINRQRKYNRKLHREGVNIHYGKFVMRSITCDKCGAVNKVWKEKESDVNLAAHLLNDACENKCDYAVIISNDTDFCGAIKLVREKKKIVDVWTVGKTDRRLRRAATTCHEIKDMDWCL